MDSLLFLIKKHNNNKTVATLQWQTSLHNIY